ncbi:hypothetical protein KIPB_010022, partial [Kipferlia bialata]
VQDESEEDVGGFWDDIESEGEVIICGNVAPPEYCDIEESKTVLEEAVQLIEGLTSTLVMPLPESMASLTLQDRQKYFQLQGHNDSVKTLYVCAGPLIDCQAAVESCHQRLNSMALPDLEECFELIERCE